MALTSKATVALIGTLLTTVGASAGQDERDTASIVLAVDFSESFAPFDQQKVAALRVVAKVLEGEMTKRWSSVSAYVTAIASSSLVAAPPCGPAIVYEPKLIAGRSSSTVTQPKVLEKWWDECVRLLQQRATRVEAFTDISGAIATASESLRARRGIKLLCVFSDFVEDLPKGNEAAEFKLSGERILMLYAPQSTDARTPNNLIKRLADWEQRLKAAGASNVVRASVAGLTAESVRPWLP